MGFLEGQIDVPDDFDRMGSEEIERMRSRRGKADESQLALWTGPEAGKKR